MSCGNNNPPRSRRGRNSFEVKHSISGMHGRVGDKRLKEGEVAGGLLGGVLMRNFDVRRLKRADGLSRKVGRGL